MNERPSPLAAAILIGLVAIVVGFAVEYLLFGEVSGGGAGGAAGAAAVSTYISRKKSSGDGEPRA